MLIPIQRVRSSEQLHLDYHKTNKPQPCCMCGKVLPLTPSGMCEKCLDNHYNIIETWLADVEARKRRAKLEVIK